MGEDGPARNFTISKTFIDTNVLAYAIDFREPDKQPVAASIVRQLDSTRRGVVSTHVLQEFYVVSIRKLGLDPSRAKFAMKQYMSFDVVTITTDLIERAADISVLHQLSFWDSLLFSAAIHAKCRRLITEDLHDGLVIEQVRVVNPFRKP